MWNEVILEDARVLLTRGGPDDIASALALNESDILLSGFKNCSVCSGCQMCGSLDAFKRSSCNSCNLCQVNSLTGIMNCKTCDACANQVYSQCI